MPMGFFGGREDLMALTAPGVNGERPIVNHVATYAGHPLAMCSGAAALEEMTAETYEYLHFLGDMLRSELTKLFNRLEVPMQVTGVGHLFCYHWSEVPVWDYETAKSRPDKMGPIGMKLFNKGYFARGRGIVTAAMKPRHIKGLVKTMEETLTELGFAH